MTQNTFLEVPIKSGRGPKENIFPRGHPEGILGRLASNHYISYPESNLLQISPQLSFSVGLLLFAIVEVGHLTSFLISTFPQGEETQAYKKTRQKKTSRATGSPFAADSCNIILITNSKASENVQFLNFATSCLSKPVLIRMKHFPHLAKLQVCLCKLSLSSFSLLLFHFFL